MLVRFRGIHLNLSDDLYAFVMDALNASLQRLRNRGMGPMHLDVKMKKTTSGRHSGLQYRVEVVVVVPGMTYRVLDSADDLHGAVHDVAARLRRAVRAVRDESRDGGTAGDGSFLARDVGPAGGETDSSTARAVEVSAVKSGPPTVC